MYNEPDFVNQSRWYWSTAHATLGPDSSLGERVFSEAMLALLDSEANSSGRFAKPSEHF
jgi:hypothetical protein